MRKDRLARSPLFPELALFETDQERRDVIRRYWREHVGRRQRRLYLAALFFGSAVAMALTILEPYGQRSARFARMFLDHSLVWLRPAKRRSALGLKQSLTFWGLSGEGWVGGVIAGFYPLAVAISSQYLLRKPLIRYLREQLVAKGISICIQCG